MQPIKLGQLLEYLGEGNAPEDADTIQIVTGGREWDDFEEVSACSELLKPFKDYYVHCIDAYETVNEYNNRYCLRVDIQKDPPKRGEEK